MWNANGKVAKGTTAATVVNIAVRPDRHFSCVPPYDLTFGRIRVKRKCCVTSVTPYLVPFRQGRPLISLP
jgi:hypothetical protein